MGDSVGADTAARRAQRRKHRVGAAARAQVARGDVRRSGARHREQRTSWFAARHLRRPVIESNRILTDCGGDGHRSDDRRQREQLSWV
jgi:hypothetical protein